MRSLRDAGPSKRCASRSPSPDGGGQLIARRCYVSGRVQGVFYRASTRDRALALGLTGSAVNLPDGRVEVVVVGEPGAVAALIEWLAIGPPAAHVTSVEVEDVDPASVAHGAGRFVTGR